MAETIIYNNSDINGYYGTELVDFSSNTVQTTIISGLTAVKTVNKEFWVNGPLLYTITVSNSSGVEFTGATLVDVLTAIVNFDTAFGIYVDGEPYIDYTYSAHILSVELPPIPDGGAVVVSFQVLQA